MVLLSSLTPCLHSSPTVFPPPPSVAALNFFFFFLFFDLAVVVCKILCGLRVLFCHTATLSQMWRMWNLSSIMTTLTPPRIISTALDAQPGVKKRARRTPSSPPTTWNKRATWSLCCARPTRPLTPNSSRWQRTEEVTAPVTVNCFIFLIFFQRCNVMKCSYYLGLFYHSCSPS